MEIIIGVIVFVGLAFIAHQWHVKTKRDEASHGGDPAKCPYLNPNVKSEDVEKNIVETTAPVVGKVVSAEIVTQPKETPVATPVKEQAWTEKPAPAVSKTAKPKPQNTTKAPTTAPKKRKPAPLVPK